MRRTLRALRIAGVYGDLCKGDTADSHVAQILMLVLASQFNTGAVTSAQLQFTCVAR